jgi:hypothetical protein
VARWRQRKPWDVKTTAGERGRLVGGEEDIDGGARSTSRRGGVASGGRWWSVGAQFWHWGMRCGSACGGYHGGRGSSRGGKRRRVGQGRRQAS